MVDGKEVVFYKEYVDRKVVMNGIIDQFQQNVAKMIDLLKEDIIFLVVGFEEVERDY